MDGLTFFCYDHTISLPQPYGYTRFLPRVLLYDILFFTLERIVAFFSMAFFSSSFFRT